MSAQPVRCPMCGGPVKWTTVYAGTSANASGSDYPSIRGQAYCADPDCPQETPTGPAGSRQGAHDFVDTLVHLGASALTVRAARSVLADPNPFPRMRLLRWPGPSSGDP